MRLARLLGLLLGKVKKWPTTNWRVPQRFAFEKQLRDSSLLVSNVVKGLAREDIFAKIILIFFVIIILHKREQTVNFPIQLKSFSGTIIFLHSRKVI